jgi:uncharacterized RDD family membrane protein YckC
VTAGPPSEGSPQGGNNLAGHIGHWPPPQRPWVLPRGAYTPWSRRVWAALIDWAPILLLMAGPLAYLLVKRFTCDDFLYDIGSETRSYEYYCTSDSTHVQIALICSGLLLIAGYFLWNLCYLQGRSGQSIGKSMLAFRCISEKTWQPIGFGRSLGRQAGHYLDYTLAFVGYLLPLWDSKRQTIADKIMGTVCVPAEQSHVSHTADAGQPRPVGPSPRPAITALAVAGVVTVFLTMCGAFLAIGASAGASINATAPTGAIGEPASDGHFQFVVLDFGNAIEQSDSAGAFVVARMVVTNTSAQPQPLAVRNQYAMDTSRRKYPAQDMSVYPGRQQQPTTVLSIRPGAVRVVIRFDVSKGARIDSLELHDSESSPGATIQLN